VVPGLLVSALSLAVVFYIADLQKLSQALRLADYRLIALSFVTTLIWLLVRTAVWRTLLQDRAPASMVFFSLNEGYLLNNLLPFRLGEIGRAFLLGRKAGLDFWQVLSTIVIERILDLAFAAVLLLATLPYVVGASWARQAALGAGGLMVAGLAFLYLLARNRQTVLAIFQRATQRFPVLARLGGKVIPAMLDGLAVLTDGWRFLRAVGWMLLDWGVGIAQYVLLLQAFFPGGRAVWAAFALGVAALGVAAPSSPGAVGVFEASVVGALSLFGLDASVALALAITLHLVQVLTTGVFGAYALAREGESLLGLYRKLLDRRLKA